MEIALRHTLCVSFVLLLYFSAHALLSLSIPFVFPLHSLQIGGVPYSGLPAENS